MRSNQLSYASATLILYHKQGEKSRGFSKIFSRNFLDSSSLLDVSLQVDLRQAGEAHGKVVVGGDVVGHLPMHVSKISAAKLLGGNEEKEVKTGQDINTTMS